MHHFGRRALLGGLAVTSLPLRAQTRFAGQQLVAQGFGGPTQDVLQHAVFDMLDAREGCHSTQVPLQSAAAFARMRAEAAAPQIALYQFSGGQEKLAAAQGLSATLGDAAQPGRCAGQDEGSRQRLVRVRGHRGRHPLPHRPGEDAAEELQGFPGPAIQGPHRLSHHHQRLRHRFPGDARQEHGRQREGYRARVQGAGADRGRRDDLQGGVGGAGTVRAGRRLDHPVSTPPRPSAARMPGCRSLSCRRSRAARLVLHRLRRGQGARARARA